MPRIYTGSNDPLDFCRKHFPKDEATAEKLYGYGTGPDDRGNCFSYDADHPDYDGEDYTCDHPGCRKRLSSADN